MKKYLFPLTVLTLLGCGPPITDDFPPDECTENLLETLTAGEVSSLGFSADDVAFAMDSTTNSTVRLNGAEVPLTVNTELKANSETTLVEISGSAPCLQGTFLKTSLTVNVLGTVDGLPIEDHNTVTVFAESTEPSKIWIPPNHTAISSDATLDPALVSLLEPVVDPAAEYGASSSWQWLFGPPLNVQQSWAEALAQSELIAFVQSSTVATQVVAFTYVADQQR